MRIKYLQHLKKLTVTQLKPTSTSVTPRRIIPFQKVFFKSENVSIDFRFFRTLPHNLWQGIPADPTLCEECRVVCNELPLVPSRSTAMPISGSRPPLHRPSGGIVGILPLWEDWPTQHTSLLGSSEKALSLPKIMVVEAGGTGEGCGNVSIYYFCVWVFFFRLLQRSYSGGLQDCWFIFNKLFILRKADHNDLALEYFIQVH
jgi:hypothetical protein